MKNMIFGDKIVVTDSIKNYIDEKFQKLEKYFTNAEVLDVKTTIKVNKRNQIIEVSIPLKHLIIRAEAVDEDLYKAINKVVSKIESQIKKNKHRLHDHAHRKNVKEINLEFEIEEIDDESIVKRKVFNLKPINEEEAKMQISLLDHNFFVYKDAESGNVNVMYRRRDGGFGLIETN